MTKIEEVAKAMFAKFWGPAAIPWEKGGATHQGMMLDLARVAIEAMREPTTDMCNAGADELDTFDPADRCPSPWDMERGYRAMIDAILKDGD